MAVQEIMSHGLKTQVWRFYQCKLQKSSKTKFGKFLYFPWYIDIEHLVDLAWEGLSESVSTNWGQKYIKCVTAMLKVTP